MEGRRACLACEPNLFRFAVGCVKPRLPRSDWETRGIAKTGRGDSGEGKSARIRRNLRIWCGERGRGRAVSTGSWGRGRMKEESWGKGASQGLPPRARSHSGSKSAFRLPQYHVTIVSVPPRPSSRRLAAFEFVRSKRAASFSVSVPTRGRCVSSPRSNRAPPASVDSDGCTRGVLGRISRESVLCRVSPWGDSEFGEG